MRGQFEPVILSLDAYYFRRRHRPPHALWQHILQGSGEDLGWRWMVVCVASPKKRSALEMPRYVEDVRPRHHHHRS